MQKLPIRPIKWFVVVDKKDYLRSKNIGTIALYVDLKEKAERACMGGNPCEELGLTIQIFIN